MEITRLNIFLTFLKTGCYSFGAATGEVLIENIVEQRKWLTLEQTREAYAIAAFAPGPFHVNIVLNLGYQLHGISGMLMALCGFVLPSFLLAILIASAIAQPEVVHYLTNNPGILAGLQAGIAGLLANAILKLGQDLIKRLNEYMLLGFLLAVLIAAGLFSINISFFIIIVSGALSALLVFQINRLNKKSSL